MMAASSSSGLGRSLPSLFPSDREIFNFFRNKSRSCEVIDREQSVSELSKRIGNRVPQELLKDVQLQGRLWRLRGMVKPVGPSYGAASSSVSTSRAEPKLRYWRNSYVRRSSLLKVLNTFCSEAGSCSDEFAEALNKDVSNNLYIDIHDILPLKSRLKLLIQLIHSEEEQLGMDLAFFSFFDPNGSGYVRFEVIKNFVEGVFRYVVDSDNDETRKRAREILHPWKAKCWELLIPHQYTDIDEVSCLWERPDIKVKIEKELGMSSCIEMGAVTKSKQEALREAGITRMLNMVGLDSYIIPSISYEAPFSNGSEAKQVLLMPRVETQAIKVRKENKIKGMLSLQRDSREDVTGICAVGVIHALLHTQEGILGHVGYTAEDDGSEKVVCHTLRKCLVPVHAVKKIRFPVSVESLEFVSTTVLTLQTFLWKTPYFDVQIPEQILKILRNDLFIEGFKGECLRRYLPKDDPLRVHTELCKKAEKKLRERASHLHIFACTEKELTLRRMYQILYPDEMLFVEAAQKMGLDVYPQVYPEEIIAAAKDKMSEASYRKLVGALKRLETTAVDTKEYNSMM